MESKKYNKVVNVTTTKKTDTENKLMVTSEEEEGAIQEWECGRYKLLDVRLATGMYLLYDMGYSQYFVT